MTMHPIPGRDQPPAWLVLAATWLLIFTAVYATWRYFCGCCWRRIRDNADMAADLLKATEYEGE